jgi:enterochelin esterase family protein
MNDTDSAPPLPQHSPEHYARLLQQHDMPLVDGSGATFIYRGAADEVFIRHWIYGLPSKLKMQRIGDSDLWVRTVRLPEESRIEYKLGIVHNHHEQWIHDPKNPRIAMDPFGGNSVVHGPGYEIPAWANPQPSIPRGSIEELAIPSAAFGDRRVLRVYVPAGYRTYRRYRLVIVHDGDDYVRYSNLGAVLDNLIHRLEIPPLVVALTNPHQRLTEYAADPRHAQHLVHEAIPALQQRYSLIQEASGRCLMGASFGAVAALSTAWRFPGTFDHLLLQSGSFAFTDIGDHNRSPVFDPVVEFMNAFRREPREPAKRVFVSCGVYESLIYENRSLVPFLQSHGLEVNYVEARDGHNWENWRDRLRDGLSWLFPGPLWVTYM